METKHDKFVRLMNSRMNNALNQIALIKNLSNTSNYHYTVEEVKAVIKTLKKSIADLEKTFLEEKKKFDLRKATEEE